MHGDRKRKRFLEIIGPNCRNFHYMKKKQESSDKVKILLKEGMELLKNGVALKKFVLMK